MHATGVTRVSSPSRCHGLEMCKLVGNITCKVNLFLTEKLETGGIETILNRAFFDFTISSINNCVSFSQNRESNLWEAEKYDQNSMNSEALKHVGITYTLHFTHL